MNAVEEYDDVLLRSVIYRCLLDGEWHCSGYLYMKNTHVVGITLDYVRSFLRGAHARGLLHMRSVPEEADFYKIKTGE